MASLHYCPKTWVLMTCALLFVGAMHIAHASDPDPLQDFCVADLTSTVSVNGFPCRPRANVTAKDFTYTGLRKPAYPTSVSETGATADLATVHNFPGLITLGLRRLWLHFDVGGVVPQEV